VKKLLFTVAVLAFASSIAVHVARAGQGDEGMGNNGPIDPLPGPVAPPSARVTVTPQIYGPPPI
jgi:hypothetical protein